MGYVVSQPRSNKVLKIAPESGRGIELNVNEEDTTNIYCKPVGNIPPQRFIKLYNAFTIVRKGWFKLQNYALWIARYGTAYVTGIKTGDIEVSFKEAVLNVFGQKLYDLIPQTQKDQIEDGTIGVTIRFPNEPLTPTNPETGKSMPSISEDDINRDNDERAMRNLWDQYEKEKRGDAINTVAFVGCGIAIGVILSLLFKWGSPITPAPKPEVIQGLIMGLF